MFVVRVVMLQEWGNMSTLFIHDRERKTAIQINTYDELELRIRSTAILYDIGPYTEVQMSQNKYYEARLKYPAYFVPYGRH